MVVKYKGKKSSAKDLVGGGPQGTLLGGIEYIVANQDCADKLPKDDRYKYYDDLNMLEFLILTEKLINFIPSDQIPSDVAIDQMYLPTENYQMQENLNQIAKWTSENLMLLNEKKSHYIVFSRSKTQFCTRLQLNGKTLERQSVVRLLGVWLQEDLKWDENVKQICIKAYSRIQILTKLKYAGIPTKDLIDIYKLFIRSITEYCSSVFHTSLTQEQIKKLENIQKTCIKVILGNEYTDYDAALKKCSLQTLSDRRQKHFVKFTLKCARDKFNNNMFPTNDNQRGKEMFKVNFARTNQYLKSTIPQAQRILNYHFKYSKL